MADPAANKAPKQREELPIGSLSSWSGRKLRGAEALPDWPEEPTDSNLRETEVRTLAVENYRLSLKRELID